MREKKRKIYEFGEFRLDVSERHLWKADELLTPPPKVFDLLALLVENQGHLLEKTEIVEELWGESFVEEANLNVNISALRRILGEAPTENRFIETVPRRGYRFVAEVREVAEDPEAKDHSKTVFEKNSEEQRKFSAKAVLILSVLALFIFAATGLYFWRSAYRQDQNSNAEQLKTIAVLPFKPLTKGDMDEALEMGMADALITRLGNLKQITVRPTSAVLRYSEAEPDLTKIGRELQVDAVLDGRIQRVENKIRVTVQMIRVSDGESLWADSFDDYFTNIFAVQDSISEKIAERLSIRLTKAEEDIITKHQTESSEAYQFYLQGVFHHNKASPDELKKALNFYQKASEKDPDYTLPYSAMAEVYQSLANFNIERDENNRKAIEAAEKAISLDPNSAEAYTALGRVKIYIEWNFAEGEKAYQRAVELKPREAGIRHDYAFYYSMHGRHEEAVREMRTALELDPVSVYINNDFVRILLNAGKIDEALEQAKKAVEMDSRYVFSHRNLAYVYSIKGMHEEAVEEVLKEAEFGGLKRVSSGAAFIYARAGKRAEAEKVLRDYEQSLDQVGVNRFNIALIHLALGEKEKAIEWLERSLEKREPVLLALYAYPEWNEIRSDPRVQNIIKKIGFP